MSSHRRSTLARTDENLSDDSDLVKVELDGEDFDEIGAAFERERTVRMVSLGNGTIRFMRQRELVDFAVDWIERHRGRGSELPRAKACLKGRLLSCEP